MDLHILLAANQAHAVHDMSGHMQCIILIQYITRLGILCSKPQCKNENILASQVSYSCVTGVR